MDCDCPCHWTFEVFVQQPLPWIFFQVDWPELAEQVRAY